MFKNIIFTTLKVFGALLVLTMFLKWSVDTCLPTSGSVLFPHWLQAPQPLCMSIQGWDIQAQNYIDWKNSQNGMFSLSGKDGFIYGIFFGIQTLVLRLIYPTVVMQSFPREAGITLTYFAALLIVSLIMATLIEWIVSLIGSLEATRPAQAPVGEPKKKRRLTATMILLKADAGGANSLVIRGGTRPGDDEDEKS